MALADFFSILLTQRHTNPVTHIVHDRNHADANDDMLRDDLPSRDLLGPRQESSAPQVTRGLTARSPLWPLLAPGNRGFPDLRHVPVILGLLRNMDTHCIGNRNGHNAAGDDSS